MERHVVDLRQNISSVFQLLYNYTHYYKACRNVRDGNKCAQHCGTPYVFNTVTHAIVRNKEAKVELSGNCAHKCPGNLIFLVFI